MDAYVHELARRIREAGERYRRDVQAVKGTDEYLHSLRLVDTVYFGGGTPSLMSQRNLRELMGAIHAAFTVVEEAEITMEANPAAVTPRLCKYLA